MKKSTRNKFNLIFSSFLVIGYIVCTFFFSTLAGQVSGLLGSLIQALILVVFGLLLFYATRVGEGKQVKRFSLAVLLLVILPCIYIITACLVEGLPLHEQLSSVSTVMGSGNTVTSLPIIVMLACIALGYGIPYTFLSGYEIEPYDAEQAPEESAVLAGGLAEELAEAEDEAEAEEETDPEAKAEAEEKAEAEKDAEAETEAAIALQETRQ